MIGDDSTDRRHVVITGAGSGIGRAIALEFARRDALVTLIGRTQGSLEETREMAGSAAAVVTADVGDEHAVGEAFAAARHLHGPVSVLVNNAGVAPSAPLHRTSIETWEYTMAVNVTGTFLCSREALSDLLDAEYGRIVNVASTAGRVGYPYVGAYCASKHAVIGLTRSLAIELARTKTTVNAVCPGYADTEMTERTIANIVEKTGKTAAAALDSILSNTPQRRLIQPEEVAAAVSWLCSDGAAGVTGQSIMVDGGEVT